MSNERRSLYTMALTFALCAFFMADEPWGLRAYLWLKCRVCEACWHGRECDANLLTITPDQVPKETLHRIPGYSRFPD